MSCPAGQGNPAPSLLVLGSRHSRAVAFLLSLIAGTWERGTAPGCVGVCPLCPCLSCGPRVFLAVGAGPGRILPPCCLWRRCCPPRLAHGARLDAAVPLLPVSFLSLSIPRGFPPLPRNALSDIGSAPSFFCVALLAWQAGELGCQRLSCGAGVGRVWWDQLGSRRCSAMWRRR